jgi:hypothetical protein
MLFLPPIDQPALQNVRLVQKVSHGRQAVGAAAEVGKHAVFVFGLKLVSEKSAEDLAPRHLGALQRFGKSHDFAPIVEMRKSALAIRFDAVGSGFRENRGGFSSTKSKNV